MSAVSTSAVKFEVVDNSEQETAEPCWTEITLTIKGDFSKYLSNYSLLVKFVHEYNCTDIVTIRKVTPFPAIFLATQIGWLVSPRDKCRSYNLCR